jgi:hypothetical protein
MACRRPSGGAFPYLSIPSSVVAAHIVSAETTSGLAKFEWTDLNSSRQAATRWGWTNVSGFLDAYFNK